MAQELVANIGTTWTGLSTLVTVDADTTYYIGNRNGGILWGCEGDSTPADDAGDPCLPYKRIEYKKGEQNDLYLRADQGIITVNISKAD